MPKVSVYDLSNKAVSEIELAEEVFGIEPNKQAMFDAVILQRNALRQGTHKTKGRSEVSGGGKKPWRQKGTGRARHGSIRSPQWRGGGIVFGPTPRSYTLKMNRKVRRLAIRSILSQKVLDQELKVISSLDVKTHKTKDVVKVLADLQLENKTLIVYDALENVDNAFLATRNLGHILMLPVEQVNVYDVMNSQMTVFTEKAAVLAGEVFA